MLFHNKPVKTGLRKLAVVEQNSNLINFIILFLIIHQVKGQFNLNPVSKSKDHLDNSNFEDKYYVNQLQNHRITDQRITNSKPADQLVESNTIRIEESSNSLPYTPNANNFNTYTNPNSNLNTNGLDNSLGTSSTIGTSSFTTIGASSTNSNYEDTYPSSANTKTQTQMGRLQSSTPDATHEYQNSPPGNQNTPIGQFNPNPNNQYGQGGQPMPYSPNNNMMGSPSLISSIFSKFNQPMGSYYPYGNFGMHNYGNPYNGMMGSNYYGSGYPSTGFANGGGGGNFIANAFYAKMRPIMSLFQRLTGKFNPSYNNPNYYYGGAYTNGMYNHFGNYGGNCF